MRYVAAGYTVVLTTLLVYALWLAGRRRRLTALAAVVESAHGPEAGTPAEGDTGTGPE